MIFKGTLYILISMISLFCGVMYLSAPLLFKGLLTSENMINCFDLWIAYERLDSEKKCDINEFRLFVKHGVILRKVISNT